MKKQRIVMSIARMNDGNVCIDDCIGVAGLDTYYCN